MAAPKAPRELVQFLKAEVARRGSQRALAKGINLTEGRLGRVLSGEHSLSVKSCLRLSDLTGEPPSTILRAAGKHVEAELIEKLYAIGEDVISPSEREVLALYRSLGAAPQQTVRGLLEEWSRILTSTGARRRGGRVG